jgi:hypothetical protein
MAKRIRRSPAQIIEDIQERISVLEQKRQILEKGKDPSVKNMRLVRMHLRKALELAKPDAPLPSELLKKGQTFLESLDSRLAGLGTRAQKGRKKKKG